MVSLLFYLKSVEMFTFAIQKIKEALKFKPRAGCVFPPSTHL